MRHANERGGEDLQTVGGGVMGVKGTPCSAATAGSTAATSHASRIGANQFWLASS